MDIKQLRYFAEVARKKSFPSAAAALFVTQPALSRQIAELEDELGQVLFNRSTRRIELTEKGAMLLRRAESILSLMEKTREEVMCTQELAGELTIAAAETPAMRCIAEVIVAFTHEHPNVRMQLQSSNAIDAALNLKMGTADFGIFNLPADLDGLDYFVLPQKNRWGVLVRRDGSLAGKTSVKTEDLIHLPIYVPRQKALRNLLAGRLDGASDLFKSAGTYNLLYNASLLVRSGACALCIQSVVAEDDEVMFLPLEPELTTEVAVAWPQDVAKNALAQAFLTKLKEAVRVAAT